MIERYDVIVVGGGHNGLVAAGYLAGAGLRTLVLEKREIVGGPCSTVEFFPGYRGGFANSPGSLEPKVVEDMRLGDFGLRFVRPDPYVLHAFPGGRAFVAWRDPARLKEEIARFSHHDAAAYFRVLEFFTAFAERLQVSLLEPPPTLAELTARLRAPEDEEAFGRIMFGSIKELLDGYLESDEMKAVLALLSLVSNQAGPRTPGTPLMLLLRPLSVASRRMAAGYDPRAFPLRGSTGLPMGGMGAVTQAMARSISAAGGVVRTRTDVARILTEGSAVRGVVLADGREFAASVVVSNLNPKATLLDLVDQAALGAEFRRAVAALPMAGSQFKIGLALDALPRFAAATDETAAAAAACQFRIAPSMDYMERGWDDAKSGRWSRYPLIWGLTPSVTDPSLAPPGKHVMSLNIYHAPRDLSDGDWAVERDRYGRYCLDVLAEYIPNLASIVTDVRFWSPVDIERELHLVGANITHGDMLPAHMFGMRPMAGWADYRTPVRGLYLCGSGTWPGGFVSGIPGHNAAQQVLRDVRDGLARVYDRVMAERRLGAGV